MNHTSLVSCSHDEALSALRQAGEEVTLSVMHYRSAAPFLLRNLRQLVPEHSETSLVNAAAAAAATAEEPNTTTTTTTTPGDERGGGRRNDCTTYTVCPNKKGL